MQSYLIFIEDILAVSGLSKWNLSNPNCSFYAIAHISIKDIKLHQDAQTLTKDIVWGSTIELVPLPDGSIRPAIN